MTFFGSKGTAHIGSEDFAAFVNSLHGGDAIFSIEDSMACTMTDANTASVALGACVLQGYFYHHEEVDDLEVASGSIGYNRHDLVVATYTLGTDSNDNAVQDVYLRVIQGTATVGEASDPDYADGDIAGGDTLVDFPLYRLTIEGVSTPVVERIMALEAPIQSQVDANASAITALGESVSRIVRGWAVSRVEFFMYGTSPRISFYSTNGNRYEIWFTVGSTSVQVKEYSD